MTARGDDKVAAMQALLSELVKNQVDMHRNMAGKENQISRLNFPDKFLARDRRIFVKSADRQPRAFRAFQQIGGKTFQNPQTVGGKL